MMKLETVPPTHHVHTHHHKKSRLWRIFDAVFKDDMGSAMREKGGASAATILPTHVVSVPEAPPMDGVAQAQTQAHAQAPQAPHKVSVLQRVLCSAPCIICMLAAAVVVVMVTILLLLTHNSGNIARAEALLERETPLGEQPGWRVAWEWYRGNEIREIENDLPWSLTMLIVLFIAGFSAAVCILLCTWQASALEETLSHSVLALRGVGKMVFYVLFVFLAAVWFAFVLLFGYKYIRDSWS